MEQSKKSMLIKSIIGCVLFVVAIVVFVLTSTVKRPVVTFVNDDGTVIAEVKTAVGKTAQAPDVSKLKSTTQAPKGYNLIFSKWEPSIENITENITVTAKYIAVPYIYSLSFDLNGGTISNDVSLPKNYTIEDSIVLPKLTRTDCTFLGWQNTETSKIYTSITKGTTGNLNLKAAWDAPSYNITYHLNGGEASNLQQSYSVLDKITLPTPTKEGMVFSGWYTNSDFTNDSKITVIENMTGDIELYAEWSYKISYELNDGINDRVVINSYSPLKNTILPHPTRVGYHFVGWFTDASLTQNIDEIKKGTTGDITLHAKWETLPDGEVFVENGLRYVFFGKYAQSVVTDEAIIKELNNAQNKALKTETIILNNKSYVKVTADPFDTLYQFDYETNYKQTPSKKIEKGTTYYFNVDPIKWRVLSEDKEKLLLLSEYVLDASTFDNAKGTNNYETSAIRKWLNETFFNQAFTKEEQNKVLKVKLSNAASTTYSFTNPNKYNDTEDNVFLLSYADVTNSLYGFRSSFDVVDELKDAKASEYVRTKGLAMTMLYANYASCNWMLRSAFSDTTSISIVKCLGQLIKEPVKIIERSSSISNNYGVRPAIYLSK